MENTFNFKLIDGTFELNDAAEILRTLLRTKINHHKTQKFSLEERFGTDHLESNLRIQELQNSLEQLEKFLAQPKLKGNRIVLNSDVSIVATANEPDLAANQS
jgi:hypothetical protein